MNEQEALAEHAAIERSRPWWDRRHPLLGLAAMLCGSLLIVLAVFS